jgi:hypothetical protein
MIPILRPAIVAAALLAATVSPYTGPRPTLWYGGDSISNAFECDGCTVAARVFAGEAGLRVLGSSIGLNGHTFEQFMSQISRIPRADVVVIELGTNDFHQNVTLEDERAIVSLLLDRTRSVNPPSRTRLFCLGVSSPAAWTNGLGLTPPDYDHVIAAACARHEGTFIPVQGALDSRPGSLVPDQVHLTQLGTDLVANLLLRAFRSSPPPENEA